MSPPLIVRTLTVCCGREVLGFIHELGRKRFSASLPSGREVPGVFSSSSDAAQAIDDARKAESSNHPLAEKLKGKF
ncbi:hypothetical protein QCM77_18955 [Bradyrhizobium sp. SSUT18]|uniref:hypothetical protein n=1 Tax=Bradyrhizobium sp. SSUT18 TaxID=3040602 RepID=UPI002449B91E|nr:hypothetical protein [Bradyrhizobium sp. SSUT18]MDH2402022.1 hypothetical protein [Bradyrhizobium sp. SSUT18]